MARKDTYKLRIANEYGLAEARSFYQYSNYSSWLTAVFTVNGDVGIDGKPHSTHRHLQH